jgi:hypothetical protein
VIFYVGLHQPSDAKHVDRAFISFNRIKDRKKPIGAKSWIMDSGAFTEISHHGKFRTSVNEYAGKINHWGHDPTLLAAVAQDYMCEPFIVQKTGLSVADHQRLTIERYDALLPLVRRVYVMPVLQGYDPQEYVSHVRQYGARLAHGAYVGVGSVCKRNGTVSLVEHVLRHIKRERSDLRLHGFGLKITALRSNVVRDHLHSSDSMAWSYAARRNGRNPNDWREAVNFVSRIEAGPGHQLRLDV